MKNLLFFFVIVTLSVSNINAQYEDIVFSDFIYVSNIKSVTFYPSGLPLEPPIVSLAGGRKLLLSFDDLDNEQRDYSYQIIHCNKDWTPSDLEVLEYIDGFSNEEIRSSDFSVNTLIPYINYQLSIPNQDMKCTLSGNYLLVVYEGDDEEDRLPVISRRFMIFENIVSVSVNKRRPFEVLKIDSHQEFDLFVSNKDFNIVNAQKSVSVDVLQNYRWDTAIKNLKPKFVIGDKMTINNTGKVSFPALKEYRPIDIRSFEIRAIGINSIDLNDYNTNVLLDLGRVRRDSHFSNVLDANGQFVIQNRDIGSDRTGGDYANVVFALESDKLEEDVYIMGAFTGWYPEEEFKMRYDDQRGVYIGDVLLKQGFYDFHYGILQNNVLNAQPIEGSWSETTNVYQVLVYLREPADQYDRIIGYYEFNSF